MHRIRRMWNLEALKVWRNQHSAESAGEDDRLRGGTRGHTARGYSPRVKGHLEESAMDSTSI